MIPVAAFVIDSVRIEGLSDADHVMMRDAMVQDAVALARANPAIRSVDVLPANAGETVFGYRLRELAVAAFATGADAVIFLGAHTPSLPPEILSIAVDALARRMSFVLGRDTNGGAYLLGGNDLYLDAFTEVDHDELWWGDSDQYEIVLRIASGASDQVILLPEWASVSDASTLAAALDEPARPDAVGRATAQAVARLPSGR